jgi:hypothetical protein
MSTPIVKIIHRHFPQRAPDGRGTEGLKSSPKAAQAQQNHVIRLLDEARAEEAAAAEARVQAERV